MPTSTRSSRLSTRASSASPPAVTGCSRRFASIGRTPRPVIRARGSAKGARRALPPARGIGGLRDIDSRDEAAHRPHGPGAREPWSGSPLGLRRRLRARRPSGGSLEMFWTVRSPEEGVQSLATCSARDDCRSSSARTPFGCSGAQAILGAKTHSPRTASCQSLELFRQLNDRRGLRRYSCGSDTPPSTEATSRRDTSSWPKASIPPAEQQPSRRIASLDAHG